MYNIAICDDEKIYLEKIEKIFINYTNEYGIKVKHKNYVNSGFLLDDIQEANYDIYILDIEMPKISGTDIVKEIRKYSPEAIVIFVTFHMKYTLESFELEIFRYIPKNLIETYLPLALQAAFTKLNCQEGKYYKYSNAKRLEKIFFKEIIYAYKEEKNTIFVLENKNIKIREPLFEVFEKLSKEDFIQADRCYIVNIQYINKVDSVNRKLVLKNGIVLEISKSRIQEIKKIVSNFWGDKI